MHPRQPLPRLWLMTDGRQGAALPGALERLPRDAGIVFRHYDLAPPERRSLFEAVKETARRRGLILLLAGDPDLARDWGADGSHGPPLPGPKRSADGLRSAPVHNLVELRAAERAGADLVFLSPLFETRSHPGARPLGRLAFAAIARRARVPVIALGGMDWKKARSLERLHAYGWAAITAISS